MSTSRFSWVGAGIPLGTGKKGGGKQRKCLKLVAHAIKEMNEWIESKDKVLTGTIGALVVSASYDADDALGGDPFDDEGAVAAMWLDQARVGGDDGGADEDFFC